MHECTDIDLRLFCHIMYQSRLRSSTFPNLGIHRGTGYFLTRFAIPGFDQKDLLMHSQWCDIDTTHFDFAGTTSNSLFAALHVCFAEPTFLLS